MTITAHQEACHKYYQKNRELLNAKQRERNKRHLASVINLPPAVKIELSDRIALAEIEKHIQLLGANPILTIDKIKETMKRAGFPCETGQRTFLAPSGAESEL